MIKQITGIIILGVGLTALLVWGGVKVIDKYQTDKLRKEIETQREMLKKPQNKPILEIIDNPRGKG